MATKDYSNSLADQYAPYNYNQDVIQNTDSNYVPFHVKPISLSSEQIKESWDAWASRNPHADTYFKVMSNQSKKSLADLESEMGGHVEQVED